MADDEEEELDPEEVEAAEAEAKAAFEAALPAPGAPLLAARITDPHVCPMVTGIVPHVGGPILPPGCPTVLISFMPAARVGDQCVCVGPPDVIVSGSATVFIGNMPAARLTSQTAHGGIVVMGAPTVMIGG
jgi:uncharacterized Zn-binding protein involved in type VI secretion